MKRQHQTNTNETTLTQEAKDKAVIMLCSRKNSSRIPSKAFRKIAGKTAVQHIIDRTKSTGLDFILAIPIEDEQDYRMFDVNKFYGNAESPLHRMADCILQTDYRYVLRITQDDILIDSPTLISMLNECVAQNAGYAYCPEIVRGADVEIISRENLLHAAKTKSEPTEYVSYYVRGQNVPNKKEIKYVPRPSIKRDYRLTLDYSEDLMVLESLLRSLGPDTSVDAICEYLDKNPSILRVNYQPRVTFYTCVHNGGDYIAQTIYSVLNSSIKDFEYIIVDDASTDNTLYEILRHSVSDKRIRVIVNEVNLGLASSSNIAIKNARGEFVMRIDADDVLLPCADIDSLISRVRLKGFDIVYPSYFEMNSQGKISFGKLNPSSDHHAGCALVKRNVINELRFRDGLRHWDGLDLYRRLKERGKIGYSFEPIWCYRKRAQSMSSSSPSERSQIKNGLGL
jgi:spore coat polysaccharide biosynthesis protein SpsF (cytidylyltransferase family)